MLKAKVKATMGNQFTRGEGGKRNMLDNCNSIRL